MSRYLSYQWDAPFSQVFEAVSSFPGRHAAFFMIHMLCCPSEETLQRKHALAARLDFLSHALTRAATVWLGVLRWSVDLLNGDWLLSRRWILTEILFCLRSGASPEFFCCVDGVFQQRKCSSPFVGVSALLRLLKYDSQSVLDQFASISYETSTVLNDCDLQPLVQSLRRLHSADSATDALLCAQLTQVSAPAAALPPAPPHTAAGRQSVAVSLDRAQAAGGGGSQRPRFSLVTRRGQPNGQPQKCYKNTLGLVVGAQPHSAGIFSPPSRRRRHQPARHTTR